MEQNFNNINIERNTERQAVDTAGNAAELSEYYERQSRRYSKRIDCEKEIQ